MAPRTIRINAAEAIRSMRAGMDDAALMRKFGISEDGLLSMLRQLAAARVLTPVELRKRLGEKYESVVVDLDHAELPRPNHGKRLVNGAEVLQLIRSGATAAELMKAYDLSAKGVLSLFKKLLGLNLITSADFQKMQDFDIMDTSGEELPRGANPEVDVSELLDAIKSGADRGALLKSQRVSNAELDALINRLILEKRMPSEELESLLSRPSSLFEIKHKSTGAPIFSGQAPSFATLVERAIAQGIDLSEADLAGKDLSRANFSGAMMSGANLRRTNLLRTDLTGATLCNADLQSSDMFGAILYKANLAGANLSDTNLIMSYAVWAFLPGANLSEANLSFADFSGANLAGTRVFETILEGTSFVGAYLEGVNLDRQR